MSNNKVNTNVNYEVQWRNKFNQLCYEVFYANKKGAELLQHLEMKHFRSPVAFPHKEPAWAYFNEGQNEMLRSFTVGIQSFMNEQTKTSTQKDAKRSVK